MTAAPPFAFVLDALAGELDRLHADALRLQEDLSGLTDERSHGGAARAGERARMQGLQRLDALTQGVQALGGFARGLAAAAPVGTVEFGALERPSLSDMAARLGWSACAAAGPIGPDEGCELF